MVAVLRGVEVVAVASAAGVGERLTEAGPIVEVPALNLLAAVADRHLLVASRVVRRLRDRHSRYCTIIMISSLFIYLSFCGMYGTNTSSSPTRPPVPSPF